jgi:cation:H+ antiporter
MRTLNWIRTDLFDFITLLVGLVLLVVGAEYVVSRGVRIAKALRIPTVVVGLTIVSFGTSAPELFISLMAALEGSTELALSNVNGSNIANIALVLGVVSLVAPLPINHQRIRTDLWVMLLLEATLIGLILDGEISQLDGLVLVVVGVAYNIHLGRSARKSRGEDATESKSVTQSSWLADGLVIIVALVALVSGAYLMVDGAVGIANTLGFSERVIGLTVVAIGTSVPELATAISCARRNDTDMAVGNTIGSNIFNVAFVLGITAMVMPIPLSNFAIMHDMYMALGLSIVLMAAAHYGRVNRRIGVTFLGLYFIYMVTALGV